MKVILFSTQWPEYMISLANGLSSHCETILMLPSNHRLTEEHEKLLNDKVSLIKYKVVFHKSVHDNLMMLISILKTLWVHCPDILHIQANGHRLFYWVLFLKPPNTKIVNTIHDPVKHLGDNASTKIGDKLAVFYGRFFTKAYIVHGEKLKIQLQDAYHISAKKIHVIAHGHFGIYKSLQKKKVQLQEQTVLFFGRIWKYKGLQYFIQAGNLVIQRFPKAKFYIVGAGEDISSYLELIEYPSNFIIVNERVPIEKAGEYFELASIVVLPYIEATQSGVIPVAFAYKKPVIATNVGALSEVVKDGQTGFLVESKNSQVIAEKVEFLFNNQQVIKSMKKNIESIIKSDLSWECIASNTYMLYKKILS